MSLRDFVVRIIQPSYMEGTGVALSIPDNSKSPKYIRWLVSHSWEEEVGQLFEDVLSMSKHVESRYGSDEDDGVFICALALYQGADEEIQRQVTQGSADVKQGSFARILQSTKDRGGGVWIIANEALVAKGQGLYSRLWCGWEAYNAKKENVRILLHPQRSTPRHLFGDIDPTQYSLKDGRCGNPHQQKEADAKNEAVIRASVEAEGGWEKVDSTITILMLQIIKDPDFVARFISHKSRAISDAALLTLGKLTMPNLPTVHAAAAHADAVASLLGSRESAVYTLQTMGEMGCLAAAKKMFHSDKDVQRKALMVMQFFTRMVEQSVANHDDESLMFPATCAIIEDIDLDKPLPGENELDASTQITSEISMTAYVGSEEQKPKTNEDAPASFEEGESVEVWSSSQKRWFANWTVEDIAETQRVEGGYIVLAGSVCVEFFGCNSKWIAPSEIQDSLRKASKQSNVTKTAVKRESLATTGITAAMMRLADSSRCEMPRPLAAHVSMTANAGSEDQEPKTKAVVKRESMATTGITAEMIRQADQARCEMPRPLAAHVGLLQEKPICQVPATRTSVEKSDSHKKLLGENELGSSSQITSRISAKAHEFGVEKQKAETKAFVKPVVQPPGYPTLLASFERRAPDSSTSFCIQPGGIASELGNSMNRAISNISQKQTGFFPIDDKFQREFSSIQSVKAKSMRTMPGVPCLQSAPLQSVGLPGVQSWRR
jgi:hypothetical protein